MAYPKIEEMTDRQLLEELVKDKRKNEILGYIEIALLVIALIMIGIVIYKYVPLIRESLAQAKQLMSDLDAARKQIDDLVASLNDGTMEELKQVIETLNDGSLEEMKQLIERMNRVFGMFGG